MRWLIYLWSLTWNNDNVCENGEARNREMTNWPVKCEQEMGHVCRVVVVADWHLSGERDQNCPLSLHSFIHETIRFVCVSIDGCCFQGQYLPYLAKPNRL